MRLRYEASARVALRFGIGGRLPQRGYVTDILPPARAHVRQSLIIMTKHPLPSSYLQFLTLAASFFFSPVGRGASAGLSSPEKETQLRTLARVRPSTHEDKHILVSYESAQRGPACTPLLVSGVWRVWLTAQVCATLNIFLACQDSCIVAEGKRKGEGRGGSSPRLSRS